jgi:hypothetical protein
MTDKVMTAKERLDARLAGGIPRAKPKPVPPKPDVKVAAEGQPKPGPVRVGGVRPIGDAVAKATGGSPPRFVKIEPVKPGEARLTWEEIQNQIRAEQGLPSLRDARAMREASASVIPFDWKGVGAVSAYNPIPKTEEDWGSIDDLVRDQDKRWR